MIACLSEHIQLRWALNDFTARGWLPRWRRRVVAGAPRWHRRRGHLGSELITQGVPGVPQDPLAPPSGPRSPSPDSLKRTENPPGTP
jgi:hypothetical protein